MADSTVIEDACHQPKRPALSRWHRLFYVLVAFAVFTVSLDLFTSHRYLRIYVRSAEVNQEWTERLHECAELSQLAAAVNAPGNEVFQSRAVDEEERRMEKALERFGARLAAIRKALGADAHGPWPGQPSDSHAASLLEDLDAVENSMVRMAAEARQLFARLREGRQREAGESMAAMDRWYARGNQALEHLRTGIALIQKAHFENQTALAESLQRFQYGASGVVLLMIGGALAYGHRVRRQVEYAAQALRDSEAHLDRRVRERTAELERANEALRQSEGRTHALIEVRQRLLKKLLSAQEDERRRIARDLHDEIGQALTSLLIGLRSVAEAPDLAAARGYADELRRITVSALEEVRRLARGLRPSVLDDLGLTAALERYAADFAQAHGIAVEVRASEGDVGRLPEEVETALYRITQEALTNTAKHAGAKHVRLALERRQSFVELTVSDDGQGFLPGQADASGRLGLSGMQERAALLNGSVAVESQPGDGTRVTVHVPCAEEPRGEDSRAASGRPCHPESRPAAAR